MKITHNSIRGVCVALALPIICASCSDDSSCYNEENNGHIYSSKIEIPASGNISFENDEYNSNDNLNRFSFDFFKSIIEESEKVSDSSISENVVVSPFSASFALALLANSGDSMTTDAITQLLGQKDLNCLNSTLNKLIRYLSYSGNGTHSNVANAVWYNNSLTPSKEWESTLNTDLYAFVSPIDFNDPNSVTIVNDWCSVNTNGMIDDFVSGFDPLMPICLLNAIYFEGKWIEPFKTDLTTEESFQGSDTTGKVKMMHSSSLLWYGKSTSSEWVSVPFAGNAELILMLPEEGINASEFITNITSEQLINTLSNKEVSMVSLSMPKMEFDSTIDITTSLVSMGVPVSTKLSKMGIDGIANTSMKQKLSSVLDEDGAKVAAVTGSSYGFNPDDYEDVKEVSISFDRPFVFLVRNTQTETVILAGMINNL